MIHKSTQCLQFLLFPLGGSKYVLEVFMCMLCANMQWKCGAYFPKAQPLSRGSLSPQSHLVSPFNLNLKPDCDPPLVFPVIISKLEPVNTREQLKSPAKPEYSTQEYIFSAKTMF